MRAAQTSRLAGREAAGAVRSVHAPPRPDYIWTIGELVEVCGERAACALKRLKVRSAASQSLRKVQLCYSRRLFLKTGERAFYPAEHVLLAAGETLSFGCRQAASILVPFT
jgi:hypothetical protein